ncbi:MAG: hypothetical protein IT584_03400 [Chlamydiae bacterium]|nr:hypothetical protein [Chlamydiota bacterium]
MSNSVLSLNSSPFCYTPPPNFEKDFPAPLASGSQDSLLTSSESKTPRSPIETADSFALRFIEKNPEDIPWMTDELHLLIELFEKLPASSWNYLIQMASLLIRGDISWTPENKLELLEIFSLLSIGELEDIVRFTTFLSDRAAYSPEDTLSTLTLLAGLKPLSRKCFTDRVDSFFQLASFHRERRQIGAFSPKDRLLIREKFTKLSSTEGEFVFNKAAAQLSEFSGFELFLLNSVICLYLPNREPLIEFVHGDFTIEAPGFQSKGSSFPNPLKRDIDNFLNLTDNAPDSSYLIDNALEILCKEKDKAAALKQISPLFKRGVWDKDDRLSALKMLASSPAPERSALIRQALLFYNSDSWGPEEILLIVETLLPIKSFFREDIVQKTLLFIGDSPYEVEEIVDALKIMDEIGEFDRRAVLNNLQTALPKTTPAHIRNSFLELLGALCSEDRKYFIAHQLTKHVLFFLTPTYRGKSIKEAIKIITYFPIIVVESTVQKVTRLLPEQVSPDDMNQILEAFTGLSESQGSQLFSFVEDHLADIRGNEVEFIKSQANLAKSFPKEYF